VRYQINAIVNGSLKDADALMRLLVEQAETCEFKVLADGDITAKRAKPNRTGIRYSRDAMIRIGNEKAAPNGQRGEMFAAVLDTLRRGPKTRTELAKVLKAKFPKTQSSVSPVITQLLDAGALAIVEKAAGDAK
jgi:DNA-binding transcriptional ArsR family regulator